MHKEFIVGLLKEDDFKKLFSNTKCSTQEEDIYEHWDLSIEAKIDVKSLKKQNRDDVRYDENFHWIELKNVNGKLGWLYGKADFFSFETEDYWIIVDKKSLQDFIKAKCKSKKIGEKKDPYELYQRKDRKDVVTKVKTLDLFCISTKIIDKSENTNQQ